MKKFFVRINAAARRIFVGTPRIEGLYGMSDHLLRDIGMERISGKGLQPMVNPESTIERKRAARERVEAPLPIPELTKI
ncbi:hypothetical protein EUZ85_03310 [Hahella sp. KA22]|nr:hypothetical protein [Hahella sp. KA22]AZZ89786.1 hypothetical protein ENC22_00765 [Hahella sp. KA22]QAY53156.1 hypothetical protein EUZ85_03310 [Hahella sp. KA22]